VGELQAHRVLVMRTDRQGEVEIHADGSGWTVHPVGG
jgi:beta-lactamase superfamily II metal-dependent hydrolase